MTAGPDDNQTALEIAEAANRAGQLVTEQIQSIIDQAQASAAGRHKTADLGQERDQGYLAQVGRFAGHVRASQ